MVIPKEQARRFLLARHGLMGQTPFVGREGLVRYVEQVGCVQYDPVDVCGKSHELAFLTRIKGFTRDMLWKLLYEDRVLMDYWDKNMSILRTDDWPYLEHFREYYRNESRSRDAVNAVEADVRAYLKRHGHASAQELALEGRADWYWSQTTLSRAALETLYFRGDLIIHHKRHTVKSYALAEDYLPADLLARTSPCGSVPDRQLWQARRRIGAVGLLWNRASDAWLGIDGFKAEAREAAFARLLEAGEIVPVTVGEMALPLYVKAEEAQALADAEKPFTGKKTVHLMPPLDCLLWDRKLIRALFGFSYTWEIYTPENKRKYGYYVLPVLYGEGFAGRVEPMCDRKRGVLMMKRFWPETGFKVTAAFRRAMESAAEALAAFHGMAQVEWQEGFWQGN